jgi:hypothetical protein
MKPRLSRSFLACAIVASVAGAAHADPAPNAGQYRSFWGLTNEPGGSVVGAAKSAFDEFSSRLLSSSDYGFEVDSGTPIDAFVANGTFGPKVFEVLPEDTLFAGRSTVAGRFATDGETYAEMKSGNSISFDFSQNRLSALGFYLTDIGDFESDVTITVLDSISGKFESFNVSREVGTNGKSGNLAFWGFVDDTGASYDRVTISAQPGTSPDYFGIDGLRTGAVRPPTPVSLPGSLALTVAALGLMTLRRRA